MATIKKHQIKIIHTLKNKAGIDEDLYRQMLSKYCVESSKELSWERANQLIAELAKAAGQKAPYNGPKRAGKAPLNMATWKQKRMIEAMWKDVSIKTDEKERKKALNTFLQRFGVSHLHWLGRNKVEKVVKALVAMGASRPEVYIERMKAELNNKEENHAEKN